MKRSTTPTSRGIHRQFPKDIEGVAKLHQKSIKRSVDILSKGLYHGMDAILNCYCWVHHIEFKSSMRKLIKGGGCEVCRKYKTRVAQQAVNSHPNINDPAYQFKVASSRAKGPEQMYVITHVPCGTNFTGTLDDIVIYQGKQLCPVCSSRSDSEIEELKKLLD